MAHQPPLGKKEDQPRHRNWTQAIDTGAIDDALKEPTAGSRRVLNEVHNLLAQRGYDPIHQIVGYLLSGDPAFITSHGGARSLIRQMGRHELLEELVRNFVAREDGEK